jgi:hypothetical protein
MKTILTENPGDLNVGDEFITNSSSELRCYKVVEKPRLSKLSPWANGKDRYIAVRCKAAIKENTTTGINYYNKQPWTRTYKTYEFRVPNEDDSTVKVDLNYKQIIIINKQEKWKTE